MATRVDKRPAKLNFSYRRGDTVSEPITIIEGGLAADLSDRTFRAQVRKSADGDLAVEFTVVESVDPGKIVLSLTATQTEVLAGRYVWDLEQTRGDVIRTLLAGDFVFDPDVTKDEL